MKIRNDGNSEQRLDAPVSFLAKLNPKATWQSVLRRGFIVSLTNTGLYMLVLWWNEWWKYLSVKLGICAVFSFLIGMVFEWQIPDDDGMAEFESHINSADTLNDQGK
jgi:hypothetical protein